MSIRNLDSMFRPRSVAVIGASNRPLSVGNVVMRNLLRGGFKGAILPVNPSELAVAGVLVYNDVASLPIVPDMAVICTPPRTVPQLIRELGARGTKSVVTLSSGLSRERNESGKTLQEEMLENAKPHLLRILGPNCIGLILPHVGLNASFAHVEALPGKIALVSQSGALCTSILDWARSNDIGFSCFVSLGDIADVDFGDVLDYLGSDAETSAILLYMESIGSDEARKFMSAARAAARNKPVIAVKSGRVAEGAKAAASHTGALAGSDDVYDAALRRAGILRVYEVSELFDAAETLARARPIKGDRVAIVTNGGGPGVLATDALVEGGGRLAEFGQDTMIALNGILPATWSHGNPVDIIGDATGERYAKVLDIVLKDSGVDAVLVLNVPTAVSSSEEAARHVVEVVGHAITPVLTSWMGKDGVARARDVLRAANVPTYEAPHEAVRAFLHMVTNKRNHESLMEVPPSAPQEFTPDKATAERIIREALSRGIEILSEFDAKAVLAAYGVHVVETRMASTAEDAVKHADEIGYPIAIKILSPDITHKSDVGGVALNLESPNDVANAAKMMRKRAAELRPDAQIAGFTVQRMVRRPRAHELIVGMTTDSIFGPVILFGQGGTAVEVVADRSMALPPLNMTLARDLVSRTRVAKLLGGYRDRPAADMDAICLTLMQTAQLVADFPQIAELDINPLIADEDGVIAVDARIRVLPTDLRGPERFAIRPYPAELEEMIELRGGLRILARPIRPEDQPAHEQFVARLTQEDIRNRFFGVIRQLQTSQMARLTQIDYDREMAFVAMTLDGSCERETVGVVRIIADPDNITAEFAIIVRSDLKGLGLGEALMEKMIRYCQARGTSELAGEVFRNNEAMLALIEKLGFEIQETDDETVKVRLRLRP